MYQELKQTRRILTLLFNSIKRLANGYGSENPEQDSVGVSNCLKDEKLAGSVENQTLTETGNTSLVNFPLATLFFFFFGGRLSGLVVPDHGITPWNPADCRSTDLISSGRSPGPSLHSCSEENNKGPCQFIFMWQQITNSKFQAVRT